MGMQTKVSENMSIHKLMLRGDLLLKSTTPSRTCRGLLHGLLLGRLAAHVFAVIGLKQAGTPPLTHLSTNSPSSLLAIFTVEGRFG